jgi:uncharacterized protein YuzB (UPF0349 family)
MSDCEKGFCNSIIRFTPEILVETENLPIDIKIKGASPKLRYPFALVNLYQEIPPLDSFHAYRHIQEEVSQVDNILHAKLHLRPSFLLPNLAQPTDALHLVECLLTPKTRFVSHAIGNSTASPSKVSVFAIQNPRPFPLALASPAKLLHTLAWIDANLKINIEYIAAFHCIPTDMTVALVKSALALYAIIVKMDDYKLAQSINFNHSMFFQDRIIDLLFGEALNRCNIDQAPRQGHKPSRLSNKMALDLLKGFGCLSHKDLCMMSVFMGVVWTSLPEVQKTYLESSEKTLSDLDDCLRSAMRHQFCIDHRDSFLDHIGKDEKIKLLVVLDDNGESVFDIALFQCLLQETTNLELVFLLNQYPVSNNISIDGFMEIIADSYFEKMRGFLKNGRVVLSLEEQLFRSFEYAYLAPKNKLIISQTKLAYIKGVNFFETFQLPDVLRYHCFTVCGVTSRLLTGCGEGNAVFARLEKGQEGYVYRGHDDITTLVDIVRADKQ